MSAGSHPRAGLAALSMATGAAPVIERHRWAMTLAMRHGPARHDFTALARTGRIADRLVRSLATLLGQESSPQMRAELGWLLAYAVDRGAPAIGHRIVRPGVVAAPAVRGWHSIVTLGPYVDPPPWWPWPASGRCPFCGDGTARGALTCGEHDTTPGR